MATTVLKRSDVDYFLQHPIAQQPTILFTQETENDNTVPFLGTLVHKRFIRTPHYNCLPATAIFHTPNSCSNFSVAAYNNNALTLRYHDREIRLSRKQTSAVSEVRLGTSSLGEGYASVNSTCAQPPRATAGYLPALSVPGEGL